MLQVVTQDKWSIDVELYGHCHRQIYSKFTSAAHPFQSTVGTLHPVHTTPMILLYAGEPMKKTNLRLQLFPQWTPTGEQTVKIRRRRSSDNDGVCSIPRLELVIPVWTLSHPSSPCQLTLLKFLHSTHLAEVPLTPALHASPLKVKLVRCGVCVCECGAGTRVEEGSGEWVMSMSGGYCNV